MHSDSTESSASQEVEPRGAVGTMPSMQFIDFEYGCHSYRGYDWGNHFCEYAGFECAYSRYPNKEHVALFIRAYLSEGATSPPVSLLFSHLLKIMTVQLRPASLFYCIHPLTNYWQKGQPLMQCLY